MTTRTDAILKLLRNCNELASFCSQNGWIINDSIHFEILEQQPDSVLIYVAFLESVMEGSGCQADQKPCYGRLRLQLDDQGEIIGIAIA